MPLGAGARLGPYEILSQVGSGGMGVVHKGRDRRVAERLIQDVRAYECYLRARHEIYRYTRDGLDRALELLSHAVQIVGENAQLYSTLGMAYWQHVNIGVGSVEQYLQKAEECVAKAFQLKPGFAPAHCVRGLILVSRGNTQEAKGNLVHFGGFKKHVAFFPWVSGIANFKTKLAAYDSAKGSVQFPFDKPMPVSLIAEIVKFG